MLKDLQHPLELSTAELQPFASRIGFPTDVLFDILSKKEDQYYRFPISKRNGKNRWIEAPKNELKSIQKQLLLQILYEQKAHSAAHGFVPNRSILTNAKPHVGQNWVVNFDISNFFSSTQIHLIHKVLQTYPTLSKREQHIIFTLISKDNTLPQGAPTSPHIANLVLYDFDHFISDYAQKHQLAYTRYADDLTFSGDQIPKELPLIVKKRLKEDGYHLAQHKTSWTGKHKRQLVTGLVVNDKINLPRPMRRQMRAIIHSIKTNGSIKAFATSSWSSDQLYGRIALQAMWDSEAAEKQLKELLEAQELDWTAYI